MPEELDLSFPDPGSLQRGRFTYFPVVPGKLEFAIEVRRAQPKGVTAEFRVLHTAAPSLVDPDNSFIRAAAEAMTQVFGQETVYMRSGGSIPIVGLFDQHLKIPSVMMGFGLPDDNLHAPNEKIYLPNVFRGIDAVKRYLEILGA